MSMVSRPIPRGTIRRLAARLGVTVVLIWGGWETLRAHASWLAGPVSGPGPVAPADERPGPLALADLGPILDEGQWEFPGVPCRVSVRRLPATSLVAELRRLPETTPPAGPISDLERDGLVLLPRLHPRVVVKSARCTSYEITGGAWVAAVLTHRVAGKERFWAARVAPRGPGVDCALLEFTAVAGGAADRVPAGEPGAADLLPLPRSVGRLGRRRGAGGGPITGQVVRVPGGLSGLTADWRSRGWPVDVAPGGELIGRAAALLVVTPTAAGPVLVCAPRTDPDLVAMFRLPNGDGAALAPGEPPRGIR